MLTAQSMAILISGGFVTKNVDDLVKSRLNERETGSVFRETAS